MKTLIQKSYLILIYTLLYIPILILILYSVNDARYSLQWQGFSLKWYHILFKDHALWSAFINSCLLGLASSCMSTLFGLFASVQLFLNQGHQTQRHFFILVLLLIILPDLVLAVALLIFFNLSGIPLGFISLLVAHITFCLPFVILTIYGRIQTLDINIYNSALDLGANHMTALYKVLLPILMPAILSAFLLCFTLSFDDVIISYFVSGPDFNILPLTLYALVRSGVTPELNALCTITFMLSMTLAIIAHQFSRVRL